MAARLKVFVTSDGLTDYVVATTSKPKALEARRAAAEAQHTKAREALEVRIAAARAALNAR